MEFTNLASSPRSCNILFLKDMQILIQNGNFIVIPDYRNLLKLIKTILQNYSIEWTIELSVLIAKFSWKWGTKFQFIRESDKRSKK